MILNEKSQCIAELEAAKVRRSNAAALVAEKTIRAKAKAAILIKCQEEVADLNQRRAAGIAACRIDDVVAIESAQTRARIGVEGAQSKAEAYATARADAVAELHQAEVAVHDAATAVLDAEMVELAHKVTVAREAYIELCERLQTLAVTDYLNRPLNSSLPRIPGEVAAELERMPKRNPYDLPVSELRGLNGRAHTDARALRLSQLIAQ